MELPILLEVLDTLQIAFSMIPPLFPLPPGVTLLTSRLTRHTRPRTPEQWATHIVGLNFISASANFLLHVTASTIPAPNK
jgi:hypothetical protein